MIKWFAGLNVFLLVAYVQVLAIKDYFDKKQYENFEKLTGIKVNVVKANADELIERLKNEGKNSPADLFITVDAGKLYKAAELGLLQKIDSEIVKFAGVILISICWV